MFFSPKPSIISPIIQLPTDSFTETDERVLRNQKHFLSLVMKLFSDRRAKLVNKMQYSEDDAWIIKLSYEIKWIDNCIKSLSKYL